MFPYWLAFLVDCEHIIRITISSFMMCFYFFDNELTVIRCVFLCLSCVDIQYIMYCRICFLLFLAHHCLPSRYNLTRTADNPSNTNNCAYITTDSGMNVNNTLPNSNSITDGNNRDLWSYHIR